ncbi:MAG: preprotein translocase subunit SecE [Christensenellales bacterium]|jgi:preprotein translocase subunit SecE
MMAKGAEIQDKKAKENFVQKFFGFFKKLGLRIFRAFKDMFAELKKVTWPSKEDLVNYTIVVLVFMLVMGVLIGLIDGASGWLVSLIVGT